MWWAGSGEGTRNAGEGGNGVAASSGRNAVIAGVLGDGERGGRDGRCVHSDRRSWKRGTSVGSRQFDCLGT